MNRQIFTDLLKKKEFKAVRSILEVMNTVDIAALLAELDDKEMILAFRLIEKSKAAEVFAEMSSSMQAYLVEMFTEKELKELLDELYMDDTVDLLENQRIIAGNAQFTGIAAGRGVGFTTGLLLLREGLGMRETPIRPHSWH